MLTTVRKARTLGDRAQPANRDLLHPNDAKHWTC